MAKLLDGKKLAEDIKNELKLKLASFDVKPKLSVILVGDDESSVSYVKQKELVARQIGIDFELIKKPESFTQTEMEELINQLNRDPSITGIVIQKPLPAQIDSDEVDLLVSPEKDVDGLNIISPFLPATTRGIFELLKAYRIPVKGKDVVVVGKSKLTGLPTALEFLEQDATVTICHSETKGLAKKTKQAEILIVAAGKPELIKSDMVLPNAVVIDIGITKVGRKLVGDVDFENVKKVASFLSPVPGGVGPMTVIGLMMNLVEAAGKVPN